jgi:hypothetical protein
VDLADADGEGEGAAALEAGVEDLQKPPAITDVVKSQVITDTALEAGVEDLPKPPAITDVVKSQSSPIQSKLPAIIQKSKLQSSLTR